MVLAGEARIGVVDEAFLFEPGAGFFVGGEVDGLHQPDGGQVPGLHSGETGDGGGGPVVAMDRDAEHPGVGLLECVEEAAPVRRPRDAGGCSAHRTGKRELIRRDQPRQIVLDRLHDEVVDR